MMDTVRPVLFRHGLGMTLAVLLVLYALGPLGIWLSYKMLPPETTIIPRTTLSESVSPGQQFRTFGTYRVNRTCDATFISIKEWETVDGKQFTEAGKHFGSIKITPNGEKEISRLHTIPADALPGTKYKYRTIGDWHCLLFLGRWDTGARITYAEIIVDVK